MSGQSTDARIPLTILILTRDEEPNIRQILESVCGWAQDVVILDSFSTDGTLSIAKGYPCRIFQRKFDSFSKQRNFALKELPIDNEWVLFLDADEWLPDSLKAEIARILLTNPKEAGFHLKRRVIWMGKWIKRGYYPVWLLRLVRRRLSRCEDRLVNEHLVVGGPTGKLHEDIIHDDHRSISNWISKHNEYARKEALEALRAEQLPSTARFGGSQAERKRWIRERIWNRLPLFLRPFFYFIYRYFLVGGFLEGAPALTFHILQALWFPLLIDLYIFEFRERQRGWTDQAHEKIRMIPGA